MATPRTQSGWLIQRPGNPHGNFETLIGDPAGLFVHHHWYDQADWPTATADWQRAELFRLDPDGGQFLGSSLLLTDYGNLEGVLVPADGTVRHVALLGVLGWHLSGGGQVASGGQFSVAFVQAPPRFGGHGDFHVVTPDRFGGIQHLLRENDSRRPNERTWLMASPPSRDGRWTGAALIIDRSGQLQIVGVMDDRLAFLHRDQTTLSWSEPLIIDQDLPASGQPGFIQGPYGARGNLEVVVSVAGGGLAHYWRDNDDPALPWHGPVRFGAGDPHTDDVALVHTSFGQLDVLARQRFGGRAVSHHRAAWAQPWQRATRGPVLF